MWEFNYKESWALKNWCFWTVVLEKILECPLDCKEIKPVTPKGNQSWMFIGGTDAEAEAPILWPTDVKNWITGKDPDAWKEWRQEEKGMTEDKMVGWHHWLNGYEVWASSKSWWRTEKPGVLQSMGLQRVEHDWASELNWIISDAEHLFMCLLATQMSSLEKYLFRASVHFFVCMFVLSCINCLYTLEIKSLSVA